MHSAEPYTSQEEIAEAEMGLLGEEA